MAIGEMMHCQIGVVFALDLCILKLTERDQKPGVHEHWGRAILQP